MAYAKKGIYHFRTPNEYGVDVMPLNRAVFVESTGLFYSLSSDAGLSGSSTIQNAIDNGNLTPLVDGGGIPPVIQTDTPLLDGPSNAGEGETIIFRIKNYQPEYQYTVGVSMGEVTREGSIIKWSLPRVGTDTMMNVSVSALKQNQVISEIATTNTFVLNSGTVVDQNFILDAASMSDGMCSTINTSVVAGELEANDLLGDIQKVGYTSTTDVVYIDNEMVDIEVGDTIKTDSETFRVGAVNNDGVRTGLEDVSTLSHSLIGSYFIKEDGTLWGVGSIIVGLRQGNLDHPIQIEDIHGYVTGVKSVETCGHIHNGRQTGMVAIIKEDNSLWTAGWNMHGTLGNGTSDDSLYEFQKIDEEVIDVSCQDEWDNVNDVKGHMAFIKSDGTLWSCGVNAYGELGDDTTSMSLSPVQEFYNSTNNLKVSCGWFTTSVIKTDGTLWSCGLNDHGQLGDNSTVDSDKFTQEHSSSTNFETINGGRNFNMAIKTDGTLWGCGTNTSGQLGDGTTTQRSSYVQEATLSTNNVQINTTYSSTLVLKNDNTLWGCGDNWAFELGIGNEPGTSTLQQSILTDVKHLVRGDCNTLVNMVFSNDGVCYGMGQPSFYQLGFDIKYNNDGSNAVNDGYIYTFIECKLGEVALPSDISGYYSKYWVNPETPLVAAPTNCYLQNHKAVSCYITQDQTDRDWKAFNNASLTEIKVNSIGATASTTTKIYLNSANIEAKLQDKFVTDSGEVFSVKEIVESPNYYVVPEATLVNAPTAVYALTTVSLNEVPLIVDSVNIGADLTHTFKDGAFNKTRAINFKFSLPDSGKVKTLSASLEKLG